MISTLASPRLDSSEAIDVHLDTLIQLDPRLVSVRTVAGTIQPRTTAPGFAGMAKIVCGQLLSVASARAIWARYEVIEGALDPRTFLKLDEALVRTAGFSAGKYRTVRVIAEAIIAGDLDLCHVETLPAHEAVRYLCAHKGIGPWTAEVYLVFCAGHPDIFPAGDLALLKAVHHGLGLDERPTIKQMIGLAEPWSPYRAAAALMFWRYFAVMRDREGIVL